MIKRYRKCNVINLTIPAFLSNRITVIENIVMRKSCSFWSSCRSWSELNVSRVVMMDVIREKTSVNWLWQVSIVDKTFNWVISRIHPDNWFESWKILWLQVIRVVRFSLGKNSFNNFDVIQMFKPVIQKQQTQTYFIDRICQLVALVSRVDVDQNEISHSCRHLDHNPFEFVICVYSYPVLGFQVVLLNQTSR